MTKGFKFKNKSLADKSLSIIVKIFRFLFLLGMSYVLLYPVLFLLSNAFRAPVDRLDPTIIWIPKTLTMSNFAFADELIGFKDSILKTNFLLAI